MKNISTLALRIYRAGTMFLLLSSLMGSIPLSFAEETSSENVYRATVQIKSYEIDDRDNVDLYATGSGTLLRSDGVILTNAHVLLESPSYFDDATETESESALLDAFEVCLTVSVEEEPVCGYTASVIAYDETFDVALLKLDEEVDDLITLDYLNEAEVALEESITIYGYPATGGKTLTSTQGQVSGFEELDGIPYVKTDAELSFGSSGGTVVNAVGEFIGIPTYLVADLGYFLEIDEIEDWIKAQLNQAPQIDLAQQTILEDYLALIESIFTSRKYTHETYPQYELTLPETSDWEVYQLHENTLMLTYETSSDVAFWQLTITDFPFELSEEYMASIVEYFEDDFSYYDLEKEAFELQGYSGWKFTVTETSGYLQEVYLIPYGYSLVTFSTLGLGEIASLRTSFQELFNGFQWRALPESWPEEMISTYTSEDPAFSIERQGEWYFLENIEKQFSEDSSFSKGSSELILDLVRPDDPNVSWSISKRSLSSEEKEFSEEEWLEEETNELWNATILVINQNVSLDGLPGWSLAYTFSKDDEEWMGFRIGVHYDEKILLIIDYEDTQLHYAERLEELQNLLATFKHGSSSYESNGIFELGTLKAVFSDLRYHRFEQEIMDLYNRGLVMGYDDMTFQPEMKITRAEALKIVLAAALKESKGSLEGAEELVQTFSNKAFKTMDFYDTHDAWYTDYIRYARSKGYLKGYADSQGRGFHPNDPIALKEALSLILNVFGISYWENISGRVLVDWGKPLMDKAYDLYLLPNGLSDSNTYLTRGEFSAVFSRFLDSR